MVITDEQIAEALTRHCGLCHAVPGDRCLNAVTGLPMQDRTVHFNRLQPNSGAKR